MNGYEAVRPGIIESLQRYVEHGIEPGGFLVAVLENNLMQAFGRADIGNRMTLFAICSYVHNELPATCHGSPERVAVWIERHAAQREIASGRVGPR